MEALPAELRQQVIVADLGGPGAAIDSVDRRLWVQPEGGLYTPPGFISWGLAIGLCVIAFPHMLVRLMAAWRQTAFSVPRLELEWR